MNASQQFGVLLLALAAGLGVWVYGRVTSLMGQLHSWSPPFDDYEIATMCAGLGAAACLLVGLRLVTAKKKA